MVLDCAVLPDNPPSRSRRGLSRRAALGGAGAAALALAGCTSGPARAKPTEVTISSDPLGTIYTETLALITTYDQSIATNPVLGVLTVPLREEHRQHAVALAALMGIAAPTASPGPSGRPMPPLPSAPLPSSSTTALPPSPAPSWPPETAAARTALSDAEKVAQANAVAACLAAPTSRAAVLASIAACRASHVAALR